MSTALRNCGRPIMFSACNWGNDDIYKWIRESGAHLFRSTGDIQDNWESIKRLALSQMGNECYGGCFCHNDIDMLVVGMHGGSNNQYITARATISSAIRKARVLAAVPIQSTRRISHCGQ